MLDAGETVVPRTCPVHGINRCRPLVTVAEREHARAPNWSALEKLRDYGGRTLAIYVAGPMRGIAEFNFPLFHAVADVLKARGHSVFNPAAKDNERHGVDISKGNATGDEKIASAQHGFNLREALALDLEFICKTAEAIVLLPGWRNSKGATAEHATAVALGLEVIEL